MRKILMTAFEPFGGKQRNISAEVLRLLPETICGYSIRKMLLPVAFGKAAERILREQTDIVFMLGEAAGRDVVTPEIRAVNLRDARIPDNEGNQPAGKAIIPGGPETYETRIPMRQIVARMQEEGYQIRVSEDAGTFVCNDTFYSAGTRQRAPAVFIHCPAEADSAAACADTVRRFAELTLSDRQTAREAERAECLRELDICLAEHRRRFPLGKEEDIVKFVFQGLLGAGHLIASERSAREGLKSELAGLEADCAEPLYEPLSSRFCRMNLRAALAEGIWAEEIAMRLYRSAEQEDALFTRQDVYDYCMSLPDVDSAKMSRIAGNICDESWLPSHSDAYREAYRPAYRVLLKSLPRTV